MIPALAGLQKTATYRPFQQSFRDMQQLTSKQLLVDQGRVNPWKGGGELQDGQGVTATHIVEQLSMDDQLAYLDRPLRSDLHVIRGGHG
jgi:hypothetical protein